MTFEEQIFNLAGECFYIEKQLPIFDTFGANDNKQDLRRSLYRVRIELAALKRYAELVDEEISDSVI